jgi:polar amino acid transport system substrate-binding protein
MRRSILAIAFLTLAAVFVPSLLQAQENNVLRVATIERVPFSFKEDGTWTGFSIELLREIANRIGRETEFVPTGSFPQMLGLVENSQVHAAAANISITRSREEVMDFSQPIFDAGLTVLMPSNSTPNVFSVLFRKELLIWLAGAVGLLFVAGNLIAFFERNSPHFKGAGYSNGLGEGLWWAVNVVTNASFTIFTPVTRAGRMVAYGLIIIGLFVVSAFVAQITASLTVGELRSQVDGYKDLYDKRVGTTNGSTSARFLKGKSIQFTGYDNIRDMFGALERGDLDAVVHDAPILAYYAQTTGRGRFKIVGRVFNPEKYGFAFPQNSPDTEAVSRELLRMRESGDYADLVQVWFGANYH